MFELCLTDKTMVTVWVIFHIILIQISHSFIDHELSQLFLPEVHISDVDDNSKWQRDVYLNESIYTPSGHFQLGCDTQLNSISIHDINTQQTLTQIINIDYHSL